MATRRYNSSIEAAEQQVGQDASLDISQGGSLSDIVRTDLKLESEVLTVGADGLDNSYAAQLAFMEEPVDVMVHESTDPNAEPLVDTYCNGTPQRFVRGQTQTVKRKFVEILARAKQTSIQTRTDITSDSVFNRVNKHTALRYPFSVVSDSNPKGVAWLQSVLRAA